MKTQELYQDLIKEIGSFLRGKGFNRKGNCWYLQQGNNWRLLDFQKSRKSTANEIVFTINLGICSSSLLEFFSPELLGRKPRIECCHWRQRIGFLLLERQDKWWLLRADEPIGALREELIGNIVPIALSTMEQHHSDEQLCREWSSGSSPGLTDIQRLMNLSVLLKVSGADLPLGEIVKELEEKSKGKPYTSMVKQHLMNLELDSRHYGT